MFSVAEEPALYSLQFQDIGMCIHRCFYMDNELLLGRYVLCVQDYVFVNCCLIVHGFHAS